MFFYFSNKRYLEISAVNICDSCSKNVYSPCPPLWKGCHVNILSRITFETCKNSIHKQLPQFLTLHSRCQFDLYHELKLLYRWIIYFIAEHWSERLCCAFGKDSTTGDQRRYRGNSHQYNKQCAQRATSKNYKNHQWNTQQLGRRSRQTCNW